jgi:Pectinacetylesterase
VLALPAWLVAVASLSVLALTACGADERLIEDDHSGVGFDEVARAELHEAGLDKYLGKFKADHFESYEDKYDLYTFDPREDGPTCLYGTPYRVSVDDRGPDDLQIYLQGGGACWSAKCTTNQTAAMGIPPIGWTSDDPVLNPALAQFSVVYVAYCDGSVHSGDNIMRNPDGSVLRYHHGLENLSAAIDVARLRFPHPRRIVLSGSSAGGFGTILGSALVRMAYPHTPLYVIDDAGPGVTNPDEPSLMEAVKNEWKVAQFLPASCAGCLDSGQFTSVVSWGLAHDPSLRVSLFSAYQDSVIGPEFLKMKGPDYEKLLVQETSKVYAEHPEQYHRFFWDGGDHTALLGGYSDLEIQGIGLVPFTQAMLDGGPDWRDLLE